MLPSSRTTSIKNCEVDEAENCKQEQGRRSRSYGHHQRSSRRVVGVSTAERVVGKVQVCCGCGANETLDWGLFDVAPNSNGRNVSPYHDKLGWDAMNPTKFARSRESVGSDSQRVTFVGRCSGRCQGDVRLLKAMELVYRDGPKKAKAVKRRAFWSVKVTRREHLGGSFVIAGDSGSWVYESDMGRPLLMLIGGAAKEALFSRRNAR